MILFIDCYDSFSYNLTHLIQSACSESVTVCHNDQITKAQLKSYLPFIHAIVLGPGPGNPHDRQDSGIVADVFDLVKKEPVPVFGVCFGYQSMALAFGGDVRRMTPPQHGQVATIDHAGTGIFAKLPSPFKAVRYHSLHAVFSENMADLRSVAQSRHDHIEMAAEHLTLPLFGVQFHPESVLSEHGRQMFVNFWEIAQKYNAEHREVVKGSIPTSLTVEYRALMDRSQVLKDFSCLDLHIAELPSVQWSSVAAFLADFVLLKSAAVPGEWSIFGVLETNKTWHLRSKNGQVFLNPLHAEPKLVEDDRDVWKVAADLMSTRMLDSQRAEAFNKPKLPFLGGLVGYVTYEGACQTSLNNNQPLESGANSDMSFVYIEKSIQVCQQSGRVYAVGPTDWATSLASKITDYVANNINNNGAKVSWDDIHPKVWRTSQDDYNTKFNQCIDKLNSGDSYELCLTTQATLQFPQSVSAWDIFVRLVEKNPAPYSSYMAFDDILVASSPERFLYYNSDRCEFRPIKGTVRKSNGMTRERATEILRTPKEQAENLMIVDLIRHDLGHLLGDVETTQLMAVEEYHTVFQLVTSVEGRFNGRNSGIDILSQSLPPGSMTGAPKKRSVDILRSLEPRPRGLYSGVHGYWSIDGRGDWSVIIRSLFQSKLDDEARAENKWKVGAGGAITVLSTAESEFDEMNTKYDAVLRAFDCV